MISLLLAVGAGIAAGAGVYKGGKAISNNSKAKQIIEDAQTIYNCAIQAVEDKRTETSSQLESLGTTKLNSWANDFGTFLPLFDSFKKVEFEKEVELNTELKNRIDPEVLKNIQVASMKATEILGAGVGALGAGALAGIASYGGAMMFASASTGTAIASLSGAAATNATLAWFGGGSLASGGLGIAGGTAVLGGVVVAPIIAVAGLIMEAKSEENLARANKTYSEAQNAVEQIQTTIAALNAIYDVARMDEEFICSFSIPYQEMLKELKVMRDRTYARQSRSLRNLISRLFGMKIRVDYRKIQETDKQLLHTSWLMTQILYAALTTPIMDDNGNVVDGAKEKMEALQGESQKFLGAGK